MLIRRFAMVFALVLTAGLMACSCAVEPSWAWSNGGYSSNQAQPDYGTHDWIAQRAVDWLPAQESQFFTTNMVSYLYGTELPDNSGTAGGIGDTGKHHVYFAANGTLTDDASAARARQEFQNAQQSYASGNFSAAAMHLGMVTHYVADVAVFGHVMGTSTPWGAEKHHSDYEDYVQTRTASYQAEFSSFLSFDGSLITTTAYDTAIALAKDTTFDGAAGYGCKWMDQNYDWSNSTFRSRAGESLNLAVNAVADVMHSFSLSVTTTATPTETTSPTAIPTATPTPTTTTTSTPIYTPTPTPAPTTTASALSSNSPSPLTLPTPQTSTTVPELQAWILLPLLAIILSAIALKKKTAKS
jgi:hypothetical protein